MQFSHVVEDDNIYLDTYNVWLLLDSSELCLQVWQTPGNKVASIDASKMRILVGNLYITFEFKQIYFKLTTQSLYF